MFIGSHCGFCELFFCFQKRIKSITVVECGGGGDMRVCDERDVHAKLGWSAAAPDPRLNLNQVVEVVAAAACVCLNDEG